MERLRYSIKYLPESAKAYSLVCNIDIDNVLKPEHDYYLKNLSNKFVWYC